MAENGREVRRLLGRSKVIAGYILKEMYLRTLSQFWLRNGIYVFCVYKCTKNENELLAILQTALQD